VAGQKRALLKQWNVASDELAAHTVEHPVCAFPVQRWGCPDWRRLNDVVGDIETQMMDLRMPHPDNIAEGDLDN
jgi:hypothetical protein